jgi:transcriptional/translational regulatory protein YebC/TACO1
MTEDDLMMVVLDAGAEEITDEGENFEIICEPSDTVAVREALREAGIENDDESIWYPATRIDVDVDGAKKVFRLIDALEDSDDVQNVYANYNVPQDVATQLEAED